MLLIKLEYTVNNYYSGVRTEGAEFILVLLSTVKPRFMNASDHEQFGLRTNFPNTKRLG